MLPAVPGREEPVPDPKLQIEGRVAAVDALESEVALKSVRVQEGWPRFCGEEGAASIEVCGSRKSSTVGSRQTASRCSGS